MRVRCSCECACECDCAHGCACGAEDGHGEVAGQIVEGGMQTEVVTILAEGCKRGLDLMLLLMLVGGKKRKHASRAHVPCVAVEAVRGRGMRGAQCVAGVCTSRGTHNCKRLH